MSLYDENWRYTNDALEMDASISVEIDKAFRKYIEKGYSPREISHLITHTVLSCELEHVLSKEEPKNG